MAFKRDQSVESFEGQLKILRPHLTGRVLAAMSNTAWHQFGRNDADPIKAAKVLAASLDQAEIQSTKKP